MKKNSGEIFLFGLIIFLTTTLFFGLRNYTIRITNNDTYAYFSQYTMAKEYSVGDFMEKLDTKEYLFYFVVWIFSNLHFDFSIFLIGYYIAITAIYYKIIKRLDCKHNYLTFVFMTLNIGLSVCLMRNCLAYSVFWLGIILFLKDDKFTCWLCFILAGLIHSSALIALLLMIFVKLSTKIKKTSAMVIFSMFCFCLLYIIFDNLVVFFAGVNSKINYYTSRESTFAIGTFVMKVITLIVLINCYRNDLVKYNCFKKELAILGVSFLILILQTKFSIIYRANAYFDILYVVILSHCFDDNKKNLTMFSACSRGSLISKHMGYLVPIYFCISFVTNSIYGYGLAPLY